MQVPLGILLKDEIKYEDMLVIMEQLQDYVPSTTSCTKQVLPDSGREVQVVKDNFHPVLFGGDQLTVARARGTQRIRTNSDREKDGLKGLVPVCEDWHAKLCLLQVRNHSCIEIDTIFYVFLCHFSFVKVIWRRLYNTSSLMDGGTLYQLRNLVNRRNVVSEPKNNTSACEDFMLTVTESHVLAAAMDHFSMDSLTAEPSREFFPLESKGLDSLQRRNILMLQMETLVHKFVNMSIPTDDPQKGEKKKKKQPHDAVQEYAKDILTMGLLLMEFGDAIREGDGNRIIRCWRFFLPLFKATGRTNYSIEAFTLLCQHDKLFSPRLATQLTWSRTINTHGRAGKNIPCDLHLEHLNRDAKNAMGGLSSNITEQSVKRIGRSIDLLTKTIKQFDSVNNVPSISGYHTRKPKEKDIKLMIEQLRRSQVFKFQEGREHKYFKNFKSNPYKSIVRTNMKAWMDEHLRKLIMYRKI